MTTNNLREIILGILLDINRDGVKSHIAIGNTLNKYQYLSKQERSFITRVCEGTIEHMIYIDYVINQFSKVKVKKMKPVIQNIMRSAVYQILFMDRVPHSAACNEAVKLAQKKGFYNLKGFVNGVLRSILRGLDHIELPNKENSTEYLSIKYSMPSWLVEIWLKEFGMETTEKMLEAFLEEHPTTIRLKTNQIQEGIILESLKKQGVDVTPTQYLPYAYEMKNYDYLYGLDAFNNGWMYVQDISSMLVAEIADPKPEQYVLDLCAAPGGKSLHVADKLGSSGMVEARDLTESKVALIEDNIRRLKLANVKAVVADATELDSSMVEKADIVLADVPCSGMGVIGNKPDIKYNLSKEQVDELVLLQRKILSNAAAYVKPGGTLIYSTCTIGKKENQENVEWFTQQYPFYLESIDSYLPEVLKGATTSQGYLQLLPGQHKTDGFFLARLKKENK